MRQSSSAALELLLHRPLGEDSDIVVDGSVFELIDLYANHCLDRCSVPLRMLRRQALGDLADDVVGVEVGGHPRTLRPGGELSHPPGHGVCTSVFASRLIDTGYWVVGVPIRTSI